MSVFATQRLSPNQARTVADRRRTDAFAKLRPAERQDLVGRIVDQSLTPDERLQISMIYTVTESELPK